jgi:branched-subunit amino acid transport protein AzlD
MKEIIKKTIKIGVIGILTFFFIFSPILVSAQTNTTDFTQQLAMAVDPAIIELIVDKSEIGKKEITVYNTSSLALPTMSSIIAGSTAIASC